MAHVGETIVNRQCHGGYGGRSARRIVQQPFQYSVWLEDSVVYGDLIALAEGRRGRNKDLHANAILILPIARELLRGWRSGEMPLTTRHYANLKYCDPAWGHGRRPILVDSAGHSFFADVD
jgi:hypothetical protein